MKGLSKTYKTLVQILLQSTVNTIDEIVVIKRVYQKKKSRSIGTALLFWVFPDKGFSIGWGYENNLSDFDQLNYFSSGSL